MEIIKSVKIRKLRSLKPITKKLYFSELNIFVGQNDQGKSNLLRALNLFFNNETDMDTCLNLLNNLKSIQKIFRFLLLLTLPHFIH
jgi:predicted ATP-dependent endonuclease of OLD family